jgi:hypothetical protein
MGGCKCTGATLGLSTGPLGSRTFSQRGRVFIFPWTQRPLFENRRSSEDQIADAQFCRAELRSCLSGARPMLCRNGLRSVVAADKSQDPVAELTRHDDTGSGVFAEECL